MTIFALGNLDEVGMFLALYVSVSTAIIIITVLKLFFFFFSLQHSQGNFYFMPAFFLILFIVTGRHRAVVLQCLPLTDVSEALSYLLIIIATNSVGLSFHISFLCSRKILQ